MKRTIAVLLLAVTALCFGLSATASAADGGDAAPVVERVFATKMAVSEGYYQGKECLILDLAVVDIEDEYGLLSFDCYIEFDGDRLDPLWQTDAELNGDGTATNVPPQMVTAWPIYTKKHVIPNVGVYTEDIMAVEGLCKPYSVTGTGRLNVSLLMLTEKHTTGFKDDEEVAIRLYFIPKEGFKAGESYTFTVDGNYDLTWNERGKISLAATSGILTSGESYDVTELRVFGYGCEASCVISGGDDVVLIGDVNGDGRVDSLDAARILRFDAGLISLESSAVKAGDVDGNGKLNSLDAAKILKFDAGLIESFD